MAKAPVGPDGLSDRQRAMWEFMCRHQIEHHRPATLRAICDAVGLRSVNGCYTQLNHLSAKGYVQILDPTTPDARSSHLGYLAVVPRGGKKIAVHPDGQHAKLVIGAVPVYLNRAELLQLRDDLARTIKEIQLD